MADNTILNTGAGGDTIATDDIAGVKHQMVKVEFGVLDSATLVSTTNPLPVDQTNTSVADGGTLPAKGVQVGGTDGSVFQVLSTDNAGRVNTNINGTVPVSNAGTFAVQAALVSTTNAGATAKTSDYDTGAGTDTVTSFGIALPASGGAVQGGTATNPVRTDPTGTTTQPVSGTVTATGPLTDTQLRASAVPVDTELPAASALADGASNPTAPATGAFGLLWNGTTWDRAPGSAAGGLTTNLKQLNGTTVDTNSGVKSAGTLRTVLATDQPALTNALKVDGSAVTQPVSLAGTQSVNTAQVAGTTTDTNSGVKSAGTQRVVLATDQPALTNALKVDPSAVTSPVSLAALPALTTGSAQIGTTSLTPQTSGGLTPFHLVSAASVNATNVKASAGQLYGWFIRNLATLDRKVAFHNTAGTPTAGASVVFSLNIPAGGAANVFGDIGVPFATGIAITTVTGAADTDATAVGLNELDINLFYK